MAQGTIGPAHPPSPGHQGDQKPPGPVHHSASQCLGHHTDRKPSSSSSPSFWTHRSCTPGALCSFFTDTSEVLVCLWPSGPLLGLTEMAGRGCYMVEEKFLTPVLVHPVTKMSPKSVSPASAENEDSGLRDLPSPSGSLGPNHISQPQVVPLWPESDAWAPGTPPSLPGSSDCVRN